MTHTPRRPPARQQTLRSTMDWSYDLLEPAEQDAVRDGSPSSWGASRWMHHHLGFRFRVSGLRRSSPETRNPEPETLDLLASLVDRSLLRQAEEPGGRAALQMLETVREYAAEQSRGRRRCRDPGGGPRRVLSGAGRGGGTGAARARQATWLERLEWEHDNLRAALTWALDRDQAEVGLRLVGALGRFWEVRGHFSEGQGWLERTLSRWPDGRPAARAVALNAAGSLAYHPGPTRGR